MYEGLQVRNTNHLVAIEKVKFSNITKFLVFFTDPGCLTGELTGGAAPVVTTNTTLLACQCVEPS